MNLTSFHTKVLLECHALCTLKEGAGRNIVSLKPVAALVSDRSSVKSSVFVNIVQTKQSQLKK